jgi:hypothetical protein
MTRRRPIREPKKPVFLGCEGESEVAYGQLLNDLLESADVAVHLQVEALIPGAGDPLARIQLALKRIPERERRRVRFWLKVILMDADQAAREPQRAAEARRLAAQHDLRLIWQKPCHEAVLLRHMPDRSSRRPPTCLYAQRALMQVWPEYEKPMARVQLAKRINLEAVRRAAGVEPELRTFLEDIGLLP